MQREQIFTGEPNCVLFRHFLFTARCAAQCAEHDRRHSVRSNMDSSHRTSLRFRRGAQLKVVCLFLVAVGFGPAIGVNINVTVGDNVTLPCEANDYRLLEVVEWSRPGAEIQELKYVLMFNKNNPDLDIPEQRFKGRVDLVDMEKGNVSLKLRNVKLEDRGTYECYVQGETKRNKRNIMQSINTVYLHVAPPAAPPAAPPGECLSLDQNQQVLVLDLRSDNDDLQWDQTNSWFCSAGGGHIVPVLVMFAVVAVLAPLVVFVWKKRNVSPPQDETVEALQP
ncbi:uncharacterized protein LOC129357900 [Poeciliopsis prolifica]|uniref:uncharacterized protein LOC129357900 n=1 Tax=Poeciliopsis prolifica TaxID=188132 RepID=UPI00241422C7|nr:uncharacterized protein LOC129357900 [Poeciliopsis prolifica]